MWRIVSMLFMFALFAACGDPHFPFHLVYYAQVTILPAFADFPLKTKDLCAFEEVPLFLFRVRAPPLAAALSFEYFVGGVSRDKSDNRIELLQSPLHCLMKVETRRSDPILLNILDCQIHPLDYQYIMIGWDPKDCRRVYGGIAFLPLNKEGGGEFIVIVNYTYNLLVLRSAEIRWMWLNQISVASCTDVVTFRGKFYAVFHNNDIFIIDPYSLEGNPLMPETQSSLIYLVPSGNDELYLVEKISRRENVCYDRPAFRVSRLDEEFGKWADVSDLGNRVLFVGLLGNVSFSAKELPDGCGVSGNSILYRTYFYKYGVHTREKECIRNWWRSSIKNRVIL